MVCIKILLKKKMMVNDATNDYKELHSILLEMVKNIAEVCDFLEIPYYLTEGSALGAVRHDGFIPWDDDLDIAIPADRIKEFRAKSETLLNERYKIRGGVLKMII